MVDEIGGRRLRALRAALVARPDQAVPFDHLVEAVWGDDPPAQPLPALRSLIHRLRVSSPDEIVTEPLGYRLRVRPPGPSQLPADLVDFVGRQQELARLSESDGRLIAITGPPGVGKTALAVHLAHRLRDRFPDGQLFVNLRAFATGPPVSVEQALARFLRALGAEGAIPVTADQQVALYRKLLVGRRVLVVIDNAAAGQLPPLVPDVDGCLAIVTSRNRLNGETRLDVMNDAEAGELLTRMRVAGTAEDRTELIRLCAYLPLALRIAGAILADRHLPDYVAELRGDDRLAALEVEGDAAVRATFDLSYEALPEQAARLFRLLGVQPGADINAHAARAIGGEQDALDLLVGAGLVQRAGERYQLHDLIRLFAASRAGEAERAEVDRLADWYLGTAVRAARLVNPDTQRLPSPPLDGLEFADTHDALSWLDAERANLVAVAQTTRRPVAYLLADAVRGYLHFHRLNTEWLTLASAGLDVARELGDVAAQVAMLNSLGTLEWARGAFREALDLYTEGLELCDDPLTAPALLNNIGLVYWETGDLDRALDFFQRAVAGRLAAGQVAHAASSLVNAGVVYGEKADFRRAADCSAEALRLLEEGGFRNHQASCLDNLGVVHQQLGDLPKALDFGRRALALHRELGSRQGEVNALVGLSRTHRRLGDVTEALRHAEEAKRLAEDINYQRVVVEALVAVADADPAQASACAREAVELAERINYQRGRIGALVQLARAERSVELITSVVAEIRATKSYLHEALALLVQAEITDDVEQARAAVATAKRTGQSLIAADAEAFLAARERR